MKILVKFTNLSNGVNGKYWNEIGEVVGVKKDFMNFTKVSVKFKGGEIFEIRPESLIIYKSI